MSVKSKLKRLISLCLLIFFATKCKSQSISPDYLEQLIAVKKLDSLEGCYVMNSDRRQLLCVLKEGNDYSVYYLRGNSTGWKPGDRKATFKKEKNKLNCYWDISAVKGYLPNKQVSIEFSKSGFSVDYDDGDSPDYFEKITISKLSHYISLFEGNPQIKLEKTKSGVFEVPVTLNSSLILNFILDTGASEASISPDIALTLIKTKTIKDTDWLPGKYYQFADGSIAKSQRFIIREFKIGSILLKDISVSIANSIDAPLLLGQNILSRFKKIELDFASNLLTLYLY